MNKSSDRQNKSKEKHRLNINKLIRRLKRRIALDRKRFIVYTVLRTLVIITMVRCFLIGEYENVGLCLLSLILFLVPSLLEEELKIEIPVFFESIIYIFIYSAWILGEIQNYYVLIPGWDTMLHTMNGFLCAAVGFSIVDIFNRKTGKANLSPFSQTLVAFCFSMTVGVLWEFIEFSCDQLFGLDMQKDTIVHAFTTVKLSADGAAMRISGITETVINLANGEQITVPGYLDIGLIDTIKDMFVNFIGAVAFSVIGYNYVAKRSETSIAPALAIRAETDEEQMAINEKLSYEDDLTFAQEKSLEATELFPNPPQRGKRGKPAEKEKKGKKIAAPKTPQQLKQNLIIISWIAILLDGAEFFLIYPIGSYWFMNTLFAAATVGMIAGLLMFLVMKTEKLRSRGLWLWTICSIAACLLTLYRVMLRTSISLAEFKVTIFTTAVQLVLPIILWKMYRTTLREEVKAGAAE
ncbi:MAG: hypothetical protein ACOYJO_00450 [Eubacterium sp.]|jgi:hypothetical protein